MVLPPCHTDFQFYTRELSNEEIAFEANKRGFNLKGMTISGKLLINPKEVKESNLPTRAISLMWSQRSVDVPLGLPFNIVSYALLLEIIAREVNMVPDEIIGNLGDCHIYLNQIEGVKEQLTREPYPLPKLKILDSKVDDIAHYEIGDFIIEGYQSHPAIKMPLSN
jgi:thymidylate synthase